MVINRKFLAWCRTIHIYLTMLGLGVLLFFGLTGFTVNHEDWFGATRPRLREAQGRMPVDLLQRKDSLRVVEELRKSFGITGALTDFEDLEDKISAGFKEPGQTWEVEIEKAGGKISVHQEVFNFAAVINNLHRGRYTGRAWSWVIDVSALLIVVACATGLILWLVLPTRRKLGLAAVALGTAGTLLIYFLWVPGDRETQPTPVAAGVKAAPAK